VGLRVSWVLIGATGSQEGVVLLIRPEGTPVMFKSLKSTSTSLILLGILAVIVEKAVAGEGAGRGTIAP